LEGIAVQNCIKIVGCILATIGLACVVKHIMDSKEGCCLCCGHKTEVKNEKSTGETVSHKIKVEEDKPHGSRYGSNPIHY
jgi:hypothetical protein